MSGDSRSGTSVDADKVRILKCAVQGRVASARPAIYGGKKGC